MVFLKRSITVLLVATLLSLTSIVITSKAHAQEVVGSTILESSKSECLVTQSLISTDLACKKNPEPITKLLSTNVLLPSSIPSKKPKTPEKPISKPIYTPPSLQTTPTATLSAELLFSVINGYRSKIGLPPFEHDGGVCAVAESRREEIVNEIFVTHALHSGFYAKNLPYWATENMIWQNDEIQALEWWLNSPVHKAAIEGSYKYACGVCNGQVCNMVFTSYEPKAVVIAADTQTPPQSPTIAVTEIDKKVNDTTNNLKQSVESKLAHTLQKINP